MAALPQPPITGAAATGISGIDIVNLFSAAASIILAIVALTLSIFFFVESKRAADQSSKSAGEISASVGRLEKLFDSLYSDTFSMMRETVTDMRKHVWRLAPDVVPDGDDEIDMRLRESQVSVLVELDRVSKRVGLTDANIDELREQLAPVLHRALGEQRAVGSKRSFKELRSEIIELLRQRPMSILNLSQITGEEDGKIASIMFSLKDDGIVQWSSDRYGLGTTEPIIYVPKDVRQKSALDSGSDAGTQENPTSG